MIHKTYGIGLALPHCDHLKLRLV